MKILTAFLTVVVTVTGFSAIYSDLEAVQAADQPATDNPIHRGKGRR